VALEHLIIAISSQRQPGRVVVQDVSTFAQYLIWAMEDRGTMSNSEIYRAVKDVCARYKRELPEEWEAVVRQTLQAHCASSPQFKGKEDLFVHHEHGLWSCKVRSPTLDQI
jgi:hypothetical protein